MKTVAELCNPRPSVFDDTSTDDVLAECTAKSYVQGEMF